MCKSMYYIVLKEEHVINLLRIIIHLHIRLETCKSYKNIIIEKKTIQNISNHIN